ncbi:MAG: hypothetical protein LZF61_00160 [Nitrosomonas sp.]|nr:MAG: hypothetical protein LZF61_00160 [Nitrosomonas sp.]
MMVKIDHGKWARICGSLAASQMLLLYFLLNPNPVKTEIVSYPAQVEGVLVYCIQLFNF